MPQSLDADCCAFCIFPTMTRLPTPAAGPPQTSPSDARVLELTRVVRISASPLADAAASRNGTVGIAAPGLGAFAEFAATCRGVPAESGYLVDITVIDRAAADALRPRIAAAMRAEAASGVPTDLHAFLAAAAAAIARALPVPLVRLAFEPSRYRRLAVEAPTGGPTDWSDPMSHACIIAESFEFAAAHRLALPELDDDANRALFGKCSNPNGHGHNYRLEVEVEVPPGSRFGFAELAGAVHEEIMRRFDHRNLNLDCPEFASVNPSVERIAATCHRLLDRAIGTAGARLRSVRVWETEKTSCRYPA